MLLDNGVYGSTGALPTYSSTIDLARLAEASGWTTRTVDTADGLKDAFEDLLTVTGPAFLHGRIEVGNAQGIAKLLIDPVRSRTGSPAGCGRTTPRGDAGLTITRALVSRRPPVQARRRR